MCIQTQHPRHTFLKGYFCLPIDEMQRAYQRDWPECKTAVCSVQTVRITYNFPRCGRRIVVITPVFQTGDDGSIPFARSILREA